MIASGMTAPRLTVSTGLFVLALLALPLAIEAQQARLYRVGVIFHGGSYSPAIDGLRDGLKELGLEPGGRLTGIHGQFTDLTGKRLQLLKEMLPRLRRVVTFYNPANPAAQRSARIAREAAQQLKVELVERPVASVDELRMVLSALRAGEFDAFCYVADGMVASQSPLVVEAARAKKLPTMFTGSEIAAQGALATYGVSYYALGRLSAKHVQRILFGADPADLPIEQVDRLHLTINLKTAEALGLTIPQSVLLRADEVIE
jgi:putative ABC transport system substrate-binding protein